MGGSVRGHHENLKRSGAAVLDGPGIIGICHLKYYQRIFAEVLLLRFPARGWYTSAVCSRRIFAGILLSGLLLPWGPVLECGGEVLAAETIGPLFPSRYGNDKLPDGFLIQASGGTDVYVVRGGKKSLIHRPILDRWLKEAHYFKHDVIVKLSASELAKYGDTTPRNAFSMGRILTTGGGRFFIDDKLRRRPISPAVASALKYPKRNVYTVPSGILNAFPEGPVITRTDRHPGGTVMYHGAYHGGVVYLIRDGDLPAAASPQAMQAGTKHEFLQDYAYETMGFPWSSQILPTTAEELKQYRRGAHISTYPDGWLVSVGGSHFLVQGGKLRWIASKAVFDALRYNPKYVLTVFPEFFKNYPVGQPVTAFKGVRAAVTQASADRAVSLVRSSGSFEGLSAETQKLLSEVNRLFLEVYDRNPSREENAFWVNYISTKKPRSARALQQAMATARDSGELPSLPAATSAADLRVPPESRRLIHNVNALFLQAYDRNPTPAENAFWVDYLYKGEAQTQAEFLASLRRAKASGQRPTIASRDNELSPEQLLMYVDFLFYFVFARNPDGDEKAFWESRVTSGLRKTITDLGGNMQYLKDRGLTKR